MSAAAVSARPDMLAIVERYRRGESMQVLARENGVTRGAIYKWLLAATGAEHDELVTDCLINRVADADEMLETAPDAVNISRAREIARFARMDLERRRPLLYGPKQQIQQDTSISITIQQLTPQPVVSGPTIIEANQLSPQHLTDQQSEAYEGPATDGESKA